MPYRVLITDYAWPSLKIEEEALARVDTELVVAETGAEEELLTLAPHVDAIMVNWAPLTAPVLDAATRCRIVARYGIGVDNIDVARATELGIPVSNVPEYCTDEVAEHTLALLLAQARNIVPFTRQTSSGGWDNTAFGPMRRVRGSTLALIGYGAISQAVAARASALGMQVLVHARSLQPGPLDNGATAVADLAQLLRAADYLSLHVPLTEHTRGLIGQEQLKLMKPSAYLINTSRGAVIDTEALRVALTEGWIAGAALDVLEAEPPAPDHPLIALDNVHITPHAAFNSQQALELLQHKAAVNVATVLTGNLPGNLVNPDVLNNPRLRQAQQEATP